MVARFQNTRTSRGVVALLLGVLALVTLGCDTSPITGRVSENRTRPSGGQAGLETEPAAEGETEPEAAQGAQVAPSHGSSRELTLRFAGASEEEADMVVVLLHGYGASGDDLVGIAEALDASLTGAAAGSVRFILPEAPHRLIGTANGLMWMARREVNSASLSQSRIALDALLDSLETAGVSPDALVLGGFSQGAMMSLDYVKRRHARGGAPIGGLLLLSGSTLDAEWDTSRDRLPSGTVLADRVFVAHGQADRVLPIEIAQRLVSQLESAGTEVVFEQFPGGHAIPAPVRTALRDWISAPFAPARTPASTH